MSTPMRQKNDPRDLLAPMTDREVDLDGGGAFRVDRARIVARMAKVDGGPSVRRMAAGGVAAACVAAVVLGLWMRDRHAPSAAASLEVVVSRGQATHIDGADRADVSQAQGSHLTASGDLETADESSAKVRTRDGLQIELQSRTRVSLGELGKNDNQVTLREGAIRCTIPHRPEGRRFLVVGPAFTVVDVGTVFTVTVDGASHASRVSVEEGEVLIQNAHGQTRVTAPGTWSPDAPAVTPPASPPAPLPAPASLPSAPASHPSAPKALSPKGATLDTEAQLLRKGLAAERQGAFPEAVTALTTLLTKYPNSPLAPDAQAALDRVKARAGH